MLLCEEAMATCRKAALGHKADASYVCECKGWREDENDEGGVGVNQSGAGCRRIPTGRGKAEGAGVRQKTGANQRTWARQGQSPGRGVTGTVPEEEAEAEKGTGLLRPAAWHGGCGPCALSRRRMNKRWGRKREKNYKRSDSGHFARIETRGVCEERRSRKRKPGHNGQAKK